MAYNQNLTIASDLWDGTIVESATQAVIDAARESLQLEESKSQFDIILADDELLQSLNAQFRGKDKPTNVLSFPSGFKQFPGEVPNLGEIYLSFETLARESEDQSKTFEHHFQHMILHGFLHLLGYDHEDADEAHAMEAVEIRILASCQIPNPYEEASLNYV